MDALVPGCRELEWRVAQESRDLVPGLRDHGDFLRRRVACLHIVVFLAVCQQHDNAHQNCNSDDTNQDWK